jgi:hypothetical protein
MLARTIPLLVLLLAQADYAREAIALGNTRDDALYESFSRGYNLTLSDTIDRAEIITEFRRAVLAVHDRAQRGEFATTERDVATAIAPYQGKISVIVQARLHPMNTYVNAPFYDLYISTGPASRPIAAEKVKRDAVLAQRTSGPIVGVRLEATFPRPEIAAAPAPMLVLADDQANIVWQARLDLSRYR